MIEITDEELEVLIKNYKEKNSGNKPVYSLKELVKSGLMYIYGDIHYKDGKIKPCKNAFTLFNEHVCYSPPATKFIDVSGIHKIETLENTTYSCWAGYNFAVVDSKHMLHAFFKKEFLFNKQFSDVSALNASTNIIYVGQKSGNIVYFDPVGQSLTTKNIFSKAVTSLRVVKNNPISSSLDGNIFFKRKIRISEHGITHVRYINDDTFVCADTMNRIVLYRDEIINNFKEHNTEIKSLSYGTCAVSTTEGGMMGVLRNIDGVEKPKHEILNIGCSMHIGGIMKDRILGYGMTGIKIYDLFSQKTTLEFADSSNAVAYKNNVITYGKDNEVCFVDIRSKDQFSVSVNGMVNTLSFSLNGNLLFVNTTKNSYLFELKNTTCSEKII